MNDDAIQRGGPIGVALASLSHQGPDGAGPPASAVAADRVLPAIEAVLVARTDDAGIELGELAVTIDTTAAPQAGVEHCAIGFELASPGKALALIAF